MQKLGGQESATAPGAAGGSVLLQNRVKGRDGWSWTEEERPDYEGIVSQMRA